MSSKNANQRRRNKRKNKGSSSRAIQSAMPYIPRGVGNMPASLNPLSRGYVLDGTVMQRAALNFAPMGRNNLIHMVRDTTLFNTFSATSGSFATNANQATFTQNASVSPTPVLLALAFRLDDLPDYTEFTALFDEYVILGVQLKISMRAMPTNAGTQGSNSGPTNIYIANDMDDVALPASFPALREYTDGYETYGIERPQIQHSCQPRVASAVYGGAFTNYGAPPLMWLDTTDATTRHFGIKMGLPPGPSGGTSIVWDIIARYHVAFRFGI